MEINTEEMSYEEVEAIRRQWLKTHKRPKSPNTVFLPCIGAAPLMYYSPKRPTRALRLLCWIVGAHLDYFPDRLSFSWNNRNTLPVIDPRIRPQDSPHEREGIQTAKEFRRDWADKYGLDRLTDDARKARTYPYIDHINPHWVNLF